MASSIGERLKITIFGESHSAGIGVVMEGLPAGIEINNYALLDFMARRAPGKNEFSTARAEADLPEFLSGIFDGKTTGSPITAIIRNTDTRSRDYSLFADIPRPSHADYPAFVKYGGSNDIRGGGHFSGRLTAPLCIAGGICLQLLEKKGIQILSHIKSIHAVQDTSFDPVSVSIQDKKTILESDFPTLDREVGEKMKQEILSAKARLDSVGGVIECAALGLPVGIGEPIFGGIENKISAVVFGIPAVKGIEFGNGFSAATLFGSENNDPYAYENGSIKTLSNNSGGILGGLSNGAPLIFRAAIKPTPSIACPQQSVSFSKKENVTLQIKGRHDPCIVPRALPCIEAAAAIAITDAMLLSNKI